MVIADRRVVLKSWLGIKGSHAPLGLSVIQHIEKLRLLDPTNPQKMVSVP